MLSKQVNNYLTDHKIKFKTIPHPQAFTAHDTAQSAHIPDNQMANTIVVKIDDQYAMVVIPANVQLNLKKLKSDLKAIKGDSWGKHLELAQEYEFKDLFISWRFTIGWAVSCKWYCH